MLRKIFFTIAVIVFMTGIGFSVQPVQAHANYAICANYVGLQPALLPNMDGIRHWGSVYYPLRSPDYTAMTSQGKAHIFYLDDWSGQWTLMSLNPWTINVWGVHSTWWITHPFWLQSWRWRLYPC